MIANVYMNLYSGTQNPRVELDDSDAKELHRLLSKVIAYAVPEYSRPQTHSFPGGFVFDVGDVGVLRVYGHVRDGLVIVQLEDELSSKAYYDRVGISGFLAEAFADYDPLSAGR